MFPFWCCCDCCNIVYHEKSLGTFSEYSHDVTYNHQYFHAESYSNGSTYFSSLEELHHYLAFETLHHVNGTSVFHDFSTMGDLEIWKLRFGELESNSYTDLELSGFINKTGLSELSIIEKSTIYADHYYSVPDGNGTYTVHYVQYHADTIHRIYYA